MKRLLFLAVAALMSAACCQTSNSEAEAVDNVIMSRRSIRNYKQIPVSRDTMQVILKAGINAPNGQNRQSWEIRVVDNPDTMSEIKAAMSAANPDVPMAGDSFRNAPVMAFIAADTSYDFSLLDCGMLSENMVLSAWSMGVGSICLGSPVRFLDGSESIRSNPEIRKVMDKLGFSEGYQLVLCVGFGYPLESPDAKPRDESKFRFVD
ncbi:MAG: nitroreductase family protein [Bacteroidales bacterium]|nr:nitroreductase family protein [Bacteroidales bacterium]MDY5890410.1 nitroreductase family protein [Candidatus Cryptobacteroides sp.]CCX55760.1 nitroreductase family protein [Bacteroides sp. CAG:1060]